MNSALNNLQGLICHKTQPTIKKNLIFTTLNTENFTEIQLLILGEF